MAYLSSRRAQAAPLKEVIDLFLKNLKIEEKFKETYLDAHWESIMGTDISNRTTQIYMKEGILFLEIDSAPLRNELLMAKSKLIQKFNSLLKQEIVKDIIFI